MLLYAFITSPTTLSYSIKIYHIHQQKKIKVFFYYEKRLHSAYIILHCQTKKHGGIAQLDRAAVYEAAG